MGAPLTDQELAGLDADLPWMETRVRKAAAPDSGVHWGPEWARAYREDVPRLIAALRGSREDLRIANEATLVLVARAAEAEATVQRMIAQADGAARRVAELEVRSLADEVRAAQEATRALRDVAPVRDGEEPDPDEEPCRCCAGPGFGRGEHLHDEQTCEHPCCPARDE